MVYPGNIAGTVSIQKGIIYEQEIFREAEKIIQLFTTAEKATVPFSLLLYFAEPPFIIGI